MTDSYKAWHPTIDALPSVETTPEVDRLTLRVIVGTIGAAADIAGQVVEISWSDRDPSGEWRAPKIVPATPIAADKYTTFDGSERGEPGQRIARTYFVTSMWGHDLAQCRCL